MNRTTSNAAAKFRRSLAELPRPGVGEDYHLGIYRVARVGREAGVEQARVAEAIRAHTKPGGRVVPDREISDAVEAAFRGEGRESEPYRGPKIRAGILEAALRAGRGMTAEDIVKMSPVPLDWADEDGWRVLEHLYGADELLFIGDDRVAGVVGESIRSREAWCAEFESEGGVTWPKIIVNPLTGEPSAKRSGEGETYRGDGNVAAFRYAVAESDALSVEQQLAFWGGWGCAALPVAALILSGKKSVHAWLRVDCRDAEEWEREVAGKLFPGYLIPLGMDPACKNPARLTRMPGHFRTDTMQVQRCIYLAPLRKEGTE